MMHYVNLFICFRSMEGLGKERWGDFSSTQTDELFWSKVLQIRGLFPIFPKFPEIMHCFVSNLGG